jgi:uncharacterized RDD family membrane protein YckC
MIPYQDLPNAALWKRLAATVYDFCILCALTLGYFAVATAIVAAISDTQTKDYSPTLNGPIHQIGWAATLIGFYCFFWMRIGQTVAMKTWRLRVVKSDGSSLNLATCILRCILGFISFAAFGLGYFWAFIDKQGLAFHDRLSGTRVVQLPKGT